MAVKRKLKEPKARQFPPYPESNYDAAVTESARQALLTKAIVDKKPYLTVCRYCHACSVYGTDRNGHFTGVHEPGCPAVHGQGQTVLHKLDTYRTHFCRSCEAQGEKGSIVHTGSCEAKHQTQFSYDAACDVIAHRFISDQSWSAEVKAERVNILAQYIQEAIEDYLGRKCCETCGSVQDLSQDEDGGIGEPAWRCESCLQSAETP